MTLLLEVYTTRRLFVFGVAVMVAVVFVVMRRAQHEKTVIPRCGVISKTALANKLCAKGFIHP